MGSMGAEVWGELRGRVDGAAMEGDIGARVERAARYADTVYKEIAGGIRYRDRVVVLTSGWIRSPGCSVVQAISSLVGRVETAHADLGFFSRYAAPYRSAIAEEGVERTWLILYGNPSDPWRTMADRLAKSISMLGYRGIMLRAGNPMGQLDLGDIRVINIPVNTDPILVYHLAALKAVLEVAGRENPSPRVSRLISEVEDLAPVLPSMIEKYGARLRGILDRVSKGALPLVVTCTSRSFAEGLILDGHISTRFYDSLDLHAAQPLEGGAALLYIEAERDLMPQPLLPRDGVEIMLRTDPISSPIYYRILSMIASKMLEERGQDTNYQG